MYNPVLTLPQAISCVQYVCKAKICLSNLTQTAFSVEAFSDKREVLVMAILFLELLPDILAVFVQQEGMFLEIRLFWILVILDLCDVMIFQLKTLILGNLPLQGFREIVAAVAEGGL